jgi:hypothetical protein
MSFLIKKLCCLTKRDTTVASPVDHLKPIMLTTEYVEKHSPSPSEVELVVEPEHVVEPVHVVEPEHVVEQEVVVEQEHVVEPVVPLSRTMIKPTQKDTLFWCLYCIHYGHNDYLQIDRNYGVRELQVKQSIGNFVKDNASKFKLTNYKITKATIQEIQSDFLTTQKETNMACMIAMIVFFNINVILVNQEKRTMLEFFSQKEVELPTFVLYKNSFQLYETTGEPISSSELDELKQSMICLESYLKPLKPISQYKVDEIVSLAKRADIYDETVKTSKTDLYQRLTDLLVW